MEEAGAADGELMERGPSAERGGGGVGEERRSETTEGIVWEHFIFQQMVRIREENLVQTQASLAQFRGSSSSLKKMLRTTSSESFENPVSVIFATNREMGIDL